MPFHLPNRFEGKGGGGRGEEKEDRIKLKKTKIFGINQMVTCGKKEKRERHCRIILTPLVDNRCIVANII